MTAIIECPWCGSTDPKKRKKWRLRRSVTCRHSWHDVPQNGRDAP